MFRSMISSQLLVMAISSLAMAGDGATEDFEAGFANGQPLRIHNGWFYEQANDSPVVYKGGGIDGGWGISPGDRAFTWTAKQFVWDPNPKFVAVVMGGDWQTDANGLLDDDRAGWSISDEDDSSDNIFGVQIDPLDAIDPDGGLQVAPDDDVKLNIEAYWDGPEVGDDGGRATIVELSELKPSTWYRLRARFTKLSPASARIDVSFVELDDSGNPTGEELKGTLDDTSKLPDTPGNRKPHPHYFSASKLWPVYKNFHVVQGGFDNAYFEIQYDNSEAIDTNGSDADVSHD